MKIVVFVLLLFDAEEARHRDYLDYWKRYGWILASSTGRFGDAGSCRRIFFMTSNQAVQAERRLEEIQIRPVDRVEFDVEESDAEKVNFHSLLEQVLKR